MRSSRVACLKNRLLLVYTPVVGHLVKARSRRINVNFNVGFLLDNLAEAVLTVLRISSVFIY